MSFFNFGPSPTKSSNPEDETGGFNMFGGESTGTGSFFGGGCVEPVDSSSGSFFSGVPAEAGGSLFGSTESGPTRQQEDVNPGNAQYAVPGISPPPPAKIIKPDPSQSQALSNTGSTKVTTTRGAPPSTTARPAPSSSTTWGPPPTSSTSGLSPSKAWGPPPQSGTSIHQHQEAQSQNPHQGRPAYEAPSMSNHQKHPAQSTHTESHQNHPAQSIHTESHQNHHPQTQPPPVTSKAISLREKSENDLKKDEEDEFSAEVLLKDMIDMQKQQLYRLVPQMKRSEEMSEEILTSASMVLKDVTNYGEKLSVTKQLYCSRLSQISSVLRLPTKTEK